LSSIKQIMYLSNATTELINAKECLFGFVQGLCSYDLLSPPTLLSLGEGISAFGLIFAVYQLRRPSWEIVLDIREKWQKNLFWYLAILGLIFTFFASAVTQIPIYYLSKPFIYPIFFEILGYLFFVSAACTLFIMGTKKNKLFKPKRASRFYQTLLQETARPKPENIEACVNIIDANLSEICLAIRDHKDRETRIFASAIFDVILSDQVVADYIVTARLDFMVHLFDELKSREIWFNDIRQGLEVFFERLFQNQQSHLYKYTDYRGISLSVDIYELIFADKFIVSHFHPFEGALRWTRNEDLNSKYLKIFLKSVEASIIGYWKNSCPQSQCYHTITAFKRLEDYLDSIVYMSLEKETQKEAESLMSSIGFFLGHTYIWKYRDALEKGTVSDEEKEYYDIEERYGGALNGAYASTVYKFIESLARMKYNESIRLQALTATTETIGIVGGAADVENIRRMIIDRIWAKIDGDFMSNVQGYFPVVLRIYLAMNGLAVGSDTTAHAIERKRLIKFLYDKIKPKIVKQELMKNNKTLVEKAVLPPQIKYNTETEKFEYKMSGGKIQIMENGS
jgi:hypothetical protein